ncbi:MAG: 1-deoxy-D-xylulose-5-phosphate reductoisomerase [Kiritimatiellae bacterium]|nr:1-deoxy-D-xylulose-5-phosphate reductoisomerase [Kiritimatiellia bacterium]
MKRITVLGATGSIGASALDVIRTHPDAFSLAGAAVKKDAAGALSIAKEFGCASIAVEDEAAAEEIEKKARMEGVRLYTGKNAAADLAKNTDADIVLVSTVGLSGLVPTLAAIEAGRTVALATKEVLVAAGEIVMKRAAEKGERILPVDSEHSAIFQCICNGREVATLTLTASGGPFLDEPASMDDVTVEMALKHPRWKMGPKVTIDSATMMNKGFEIMEARWLFDCDVKRIKTVVHPESIIHSLVTFTDGATLAQLAPPDMRIPIQYAFTWPERIPSQRAELDLADIGSLTFREANEIRFPCLRLAREACKAGGTAPAVLSAADEVAVRSFIEGAIRFADIPRIVEETLSKVPILSCDSIANVLEADRRAREFAEFAAFGMAVGN